MLVVTPDRAFKGIVWLSELDADADPVQLKDVMEEDHPVGRPDALLEHGMQRFEDGATVIPIVDWNERVLGVATRESIIRAYEAAQGNSLLDKEE